jgi:hypothetical protein
VLGDAAVYPGLSAFNPRRAGAKKGA